MPVDQLEIFDCEQGTDEWFQCRAGVITASEIHNVMANGKAGEPSKTRRQYLLVTVAELITGRAAQRKFQGTVNTDRGKAQEAEGRRLYGLQRGVEPRTVGFMKRGRIGCSPDFLVGDEGGGEIKCKLEDIHLEVLLSGKTPAEHIKQIQFTLFVTGRQWWDFVSYCPGLPLFIERHYPDRQLHREMEAACKSFIIDAEVLVNTVLKK